MSLDLRTGSASGGALQVGGQISLPDTASIRWGDPTLGYRPKTLSQAPSSYFGVDEPSGSFLDAIATGFTGALAGNTQRGIGSKVEGAAVKFGGALADKISFGHLGAYDFTTANSFSVSFWVRKDGTMTDLGATLNHYWIVSQITANNAATNSGWGIFFDGSRICFGTENRFGAFQRDSLGAFAPATSAWNHIGISFATNFPTETCTAKYHLNGALVTTTNNLSLAINATNATPFTLGGAFVDTVVVGGGAGFSWSGALDEVAVWNRVVSTAEFLAAYSANVGASYAIREGSRQGALKVDGALDVPEGVSTREINTAGLTSAQIDATFAVTPVDGAIVSDPTNSLALVRQAGKWYKTAALTQIA